MDAESTPGVHASPGTCPRAGHPTLQGTEPSSQRERLFLEASPGTLRSDCPFSLLRDGPDQSSPQLGVFSGNTALETAYSSTNQVLLKFHSDFSNGGFFVLNFHGERVFTPERGRRLPSGFLQS